MRSNKVHVTVMVLLIITIGQLYAQEEREVSFFVPEGTQYSSLPFNGKSATIAIHPNGSTSFTQDNSILVNGKIIEMPSRIRPSTICWTDSASLVLFFDDTIYLLSSTYSLQPLIEVDAEKIVVRELGKGNFAFCAVGDTVIYQYDVLQKKNILLFHCSMPISDFVVDGEDIFFATGKYVVAYLKEKLYLPLFQNTQPIWRIAFCGSESMFLSDNEGLWLINKDREKVSVTDQPIVDIVTDRFGHGFFETSDGSWVFVYPIHNYEINNTEHK